MNIEEVLIEKYGVLLTLPQLAETLKRSPDGLRLSLRSSSEFSRMINTTRVKLGRRVYFRTPQVAILLESLGR